MPLRMPLPIRSLGPYRYADAGSPEAPAVVFLHGMLGDVGNFEESASTVAAAGFRALIPLLPVYGLPLGQTSVSGLAEHFAGFFEALRLRDAVLVGNSLGGHVALLFAQRHPDVVRALVLAGSSGLYEVSIGVSTPKRFDREFVRDRTAFTFHDPRHATDALVDEMLSIIGDRERLLRLVKMARSARSTTMEGVLPSITAPTLLVWGRDDRITPPFVAEEFARLLPHAQIAWINACAHAPMIEQPEAFHTYLLDFLMLVAARQASAA